MSEQVRSVTLHRDRARLHPDTPHFVSTRRTLGDRERAPVTGARCNHGDPNAGALERSQAR
ncbi:hypothetical protein MSMEI_3725 [Mycolicibacterium smegmatis MC2 155]|uniref:Uncharacterized protein n=1 Tax=Mycolicibacterium smegmatis (strain ATCC 700084 / mc(2)155) TaxID=246196 RepID=I7FNA2_MYCS2|nr:hypothetical protein MSMEI_3725 [Mycolicibacterium smegmatis MC2 155]